MHLPKRLFPPERGHEYLKTFLQPVKPHHAAALSSNLISKNFARVSLRASPSLAQCNGGGGRGLGSGDRNGPKKSTSPPRPGADLCAHSPRSGSQQPFLLPGKLNLPALCCPSSWRSRGDRHRQRQNPQRSRGPREQNEDESPRNAGPWNLARESPWRIGPRC